MLTPTIIIAILGPMNLLLLAGSSRKNQAWIHDVEKVLSPLFTATLVHEYAHWRDDRIPASFDNELTRIERVLQQLGWSEGYAIFAKSFGSMLSLKGMSMGVLKPTKCIFTGIPLRMVEHERLLFQTWLEAISVPMLMIQNAHDPLGSFEALNTIVGSHGQHCQLVELPGDTHKYSDLERLKALVNDFIT